MRQSVTRTRAAATWMPGRVAPQIASATPVDLEAARSDVRRAHADDAAGARSEKSRGRPSPMSASVLVDQEVALVGAGTDNNTVAGPRAVNARLQWRCVLLPRTPFDASGGSRRQCVALHGALGEAAAAISTRTVMARAPRAAPAEPFAKPARTRGRGEASKRPSRRTRPADRNTPRSWQFADSRTSAA